MNYRRVWSTFRQTYSAWNEHEAPRMSAALAFYTILSLAPLFILASALAALIFGDSTAQNQLLGQVESMIGRPESDTVKGMIEHAQKPATGTFASIIGVITLLFVASGVFSELRSALDRMWDVKPESEGVWATITQRFFSFAMVLAVGFLLLVSLVISAALVAFGKLFSGFLPMPQFVTGSLVVVIVWVYYSTMIFLFGAEFTHVLDFGSHSQNARTS